MLGAARGSRDAGRDHGIGWADFRARQASGLSQDPRGLDDVAYAAAAGDRAELDRALNRVYFEGTNPIAVLRAATRHFQRLHFASGMIARGQSADKVLEALRPPLFFKTKPKFRAQLKIWPLERIGAAFELLMEAELQCKTTGMPAGTICARALMRIAQAARKS